MAETKYGIAKAKPSFPSIDLSRVPHKGKTLVLAHPAFGPNTYSENSKEMQKIYSHSAQFPQISFRPATTSQSISAVVYNIEDTKEKILDPRWLQLSHIVKTSEGVFANPPKDKEGSPIIDEKNLKYLLNRVKKVNGIYLCENDFGFAPYETFSQGLRDCNTFANSGLARLLEHTEEKTAQNLRTIASPKFYKNGVNVWGFDEVKEPVLRVASLVSGGDFGSSGLLVGGDGWDGGSDGYAFGVVDSEAGDARKISSE